MQIGAPNGLHYPITVTDIAKHQGDDVARSQPLFHYSFESIREETNRWGDTKEVLHKFFASFEAPVDGHIETWHIKKDQIISKPGTLLLEITEPCTHEEQFGGLCTMCGKDMTEVDYLTEKLDITRATVNMTHDNTALLVSHKEARKAEEAAKTRLLEAKKLTLIVDLDQTVIHTTCERTIAEWKSDPTNPNYKFVEDVEGFQLADDNVAHIAANWYYVKKRPGLKDFFDNMSQLYEMHIYTMATRAYAQAVAKIIDPDRKYFGDRILSRDENGTDKAKSLHRLFPNNPGMVVIIDDRADVWNYSPYLVRVPVFNFFPGAGDINASFLPKQLEVPAPAPAFKDKVENKARPDSEGIPFSVAGKPLSPKPLNPDSADTTNGVENDLEERMIAMGAGESQEALEERVREQEKIIVAQQTERPLLQQQLTLEKEDDEEEAARSEIPENGGTQSTEHHKHHRAILNNNDDGLEVVEKNLRRVYEAFYDEYQRSIVKPRGSRVAELKGEKSPRKPRLEGIVPDIAYIMPRIKSETLATCVIVFSGIIPLGMDVET
ncbi:CTD phosphatase Fcp1 [Paraconiothyrium brasiliense]|uniref:RNA polymerase II subunit A C-terminal domain phosphatase n=1 Tax=Paraconiothyrium brasiliense TaxID=300254 RepID=A0ABR3QQ68_9PLEO